MAAPTAGSTWLGGLALAIAMVAGTSCAPPYPSCRHDKHCKVQEGERCLADVCQECKSDGDCKDEGRPICEEFRCVEEYVPTQEPAPPRSPAPCVDRGDCEPSQVCDAGVCGPCRDDLACSPEVCDLDAGRCISPSSAPPENAPGGALENALGGALTPEYQAWVLARWQIALKGNQRPQAYAPCRAGRHCRLRWDVDWQLFERDSSVVRPDPSLATMLAEGLSDDPSARLILVGHASAEEADADTLAVIRAERVRAWLVSEGLDANRMGVKGEGTSRPVYVRSSEHSGAADRRVEFLLSSDASPVGWWPPGTKQGRGTKAGRGTKPAPEPKPTPEPEPTPGPAPAPVVAPTTPDAPLPAFPPAPAPAG